MWLIRIWSIASARTCAVARGGLVGRLELLIGEVEEQARTVLGPLMDQLSGLVLGQRRCHLLALQCWAAGRHLLADREPDDPQVIDDCLGDVLGLLADRPGAWVRDAVPVVVIDRFDHGDGGVRRGPQSRRERAGPGQRRPRVPLGGTLTVTSAPIGLVAIHP